MACNLAGLHLAGLAQWTGAAAASFPARVGGPEGGHRGATRPEGAPHGLYFGA